MNKVIPHTRDCAYHWDGECSCAPKTREELQQQIDYLIGSNKRLTAERDAARAMLWECRDRIRTAIRGEGWLLPANVEDLVDEIETLLNR